MGEVKKRIKAIGCGRKKGKKWRPLEVLFPKRVRGRIGKKDWRRKGKGEIEGIEGRG